MWHHVYVAAMKINRLSAAILPFALADLLLAGGCKKQDQQASNESQPAASAPAAAPAPATSPSTGTPAAPPASSAPAPPPAAAGPAPTRPPPPPPPIVIPAGTHVSVTTTQELGSKLSQPGQSFSATVAAPV